MRKLQSLAVSLSLAAFTLLGCGQDAAELALNWNGDNGGNLEIQNGTNKDMVLFIGQQPTSSNIMGGINAGKTLNFDVCKHQSDCNVGGYTVIRGISRDEYNNNGLDLSKSRVEYQAMATYGPGKKYRLVMNPGYMGDFGFKISNLGKIGIEIRKDSPEGEKIAYLPSMQQNQMLYTNTTTAFDMFPVYVFYNKTTGEVTTLNSTSLWDAVLATPRPLAGSQAVNSYTLPAGEGVSWQDIVNGLKSPTAYLTVKNGTQAAYFMDGNQELLSQEGYNAIGGGEQLLYEVKGKDCDVPKGETVDPTCGTQIPSLVVRVRTLYIPVRMKGCVADDAEILKCVQPIKNGWNYTVTIAGAGTTADGYTAIIEEDQKRDFSDQIGTL